VIIKTIPLLFSLLAVASIAFTGVLGNTQTAYAGIPPITQCTIEPAEVKLQLGLNEESDVIRKIITCDNRASDIGIQDDCQFNDASITNIVGISTKVITFDETVTNLGDTSEEHCTVTIGVIDFFSGNVFEVFQELWINEPQIAGELLPLDSTALFLAGIQSMTIWMVPTVLGLAGVGVYLVKFRKQ
jgi:hypothetical protein